MTPIEPILLSAPERQTSVSAINMMKYIVGSPLIMSLDNYGRVSTRYILALLKFRKRGPIFEVILQYNEITLGVYFMLKNDTYLRTRSRRWRMYAFAMSFPGRNEESFENIVKHLQLVYHM